jgi:DNA-binding winged helix-turn-helix (wHTH) protein/Tol biopolymer transport system component
VQLPTNSLQQIHFAEFELDLATCELRTDGLKIDLQGQPFQILLALLERPGQLVTREDLKNRLWPSDTFVDFDHSLNRAVNRLREALEDSAEHPRFVETLPRRGYRFIASLDGLAIERAAAPSSQQSSSTPPDRRTNAPRPIEVAEATAIAAAAAPAPMSSPQSPVGVGKSTYVVITAISVVIAVVAIFGLYLWQTRRGPLSLAEIQINKLTDSGAVGDLAISPDGHYVVYSGRDGEKESLWLRQVTTRSEVQILPSGPEFHGLTFSPDGNFVYFVRSDPNDPFYKYLYSIPVLGGPARQLIADVDSPVSFSPDGHQFAFERGVASRNVVELRIANADGSGDRVVTTIQNGDVGLFQPGPNWSPDGRTIVASFRIVARPIPWVLASVSASDGSVREIYSSPVPIGRPVWLSGQSLLVPHYDPAYQRAQLWTISYPEGRARRFTNDLTDYDSQLDITRDRGTVAAIASTWTSNIWVAPAADPSRTRQITFGELPMLDTAEVADGKLLSTSGDGGLWLMNSDGSQRTPFAEAHEAGWLTPCGRFVLFVSFEPGIATLTRVDTDGTHSTKLVSGDLYAPACSPDGRFVFYVNGHQPQRIWRMSIEGGSPVAIAAGMGDGITGRLGVRPDGRLLAYPFDEYPPAWKIAVIPAGGGTPIKTFKVPGGIRSMRWSPNGAGLQYLSTQNGATNIWEQPLAGGEPKQLTNFTSGLIFDFNSSFDHTKLLLTRGSVSSNVVLLSKFR